MRLLLVLTVFACKQPAGEADPCAQYPGSVCPGQLHPAGEGNKNKGKTEVGKLGKQDKLGQGSKLGKEGSEPDQTAQHEQVSQTDPDDQSNQGAQGRQGNQAHDGGVGTEIEHEPDDQSNQGEQGRQGNQAHDGGNVGADLEIEYEQEAELSDLKVYAYFSREQGVEGESSPRSEEGYAIGLYFSVWKGLPQQLREQITSTLTLLYGEHKLSWDGGNMLTFKLPVKLLFTVDQQQHCWQAELKATHFAQALIKADFVLDEDGYRTALRNKNQALGKMLAMTHTPGDC